MEYKSIEFKAEDIDTKKMEVSGYISTWDEDLVGDIIHPGAFKKSINESFSRGKIKALWEHTLPMGMPKHMAEDSKGVYVVTKLSKTIENEARMEYMKDGVVDSQSIGFNLVKGKFEFDDKGRRNIYEVKLSEYSAVMFPANPHATFDSMKALSAELLIAKSKGLHVTGSKELSYLLDSLKALMQTNEPLINTHNEAKPLIDECLISLKSLGDFAKSLNK